MKRYTAVLMSVTLALVATGLVSGSNSVTTAPEADASATVIVEDESWNISTSNYVNRLIQMGVPNSGVCPTVA